ncbi:MAG TPA: hypothetical protein VMH41_03280 [Mycobacteriales bacterium]|nr:hypothetical protein [Mycobacteriales bacterium]
MTTDEPSAAPTFAELDALSDRDLRERAFAVAEHHHDLGFFWDLVKHLRGAEDFGSDDGSAGGLGESLTGAAEVVAGLLGRGEDTLDPMVRARFISYLQEHG